MPLAQPNLGTITLSAGVLAISNAGSLAIDGSGRSVEISGNNATQIFDIASGATVTVATLTLRNGNAGSGGAINNDGNLTITGSTLKDNSATGTGGGAIYSGGSLTVMSCSFSGNSASPSSGFGGAIRSTGSGSQTTTIVNSTFSGNSASKGGGLANGGSIVTITNSTFSDSVVYQGGGTINLRNSIVANSSASNCVRDTTAPGGGGTFNTQHSLIEDASSLTNCSNGMNIANLSGDPALGALTGSPAYFPLASASIAIGAGNNSLVPVGVTTDQAGNSRILDGTVDMGAAEWVPPLVGIAPTSASVPEGSNADFTITRAGSTAAALTVNLTLTPANASMTAADYTLSGAGISGQTGSVTVVIPAAASSVTVNFAATADGTSIAEPNNALTLTVADGAGYDPDTNSSATATIPANGLGVVNTDDSGEGSLRQAILNANAFPSDDVIEAPAGTITLTSAELTVADNGTLTILGSKGGTTISGNSARRVLNINAGANVTLRYLSIVHGRANGNYGGGVYAHTGSTLAVYGSYFFDNRADTSNGYGGAIVASNSASLTVVNSTFHSNSAVNGGAIAKILPVGPTTLINVTIIGNVANQGGGLLMNAATANIYNSIIANNIGGDCVRSSLNTSTINSRNSLIADGLGCVNGTNTANLTGDPNLGALTGDPAYFPLNFGSPVVNGGDNSLLPVGVDIDQAGNARVQGGTVDMGSIESSFALPTQLSFLQQPGNTTGGASISPAITVRALDQYGNLAYYTGNITLAIGSNPAGGTLSGTTTVAAVAGVATFSGLSINAAGTGYTLAASSSGLTGATSNTFNITAGAPTRLAFSQQPSNATGGATLSPAPTVRLLDAVGNLTASTANVTLAIASNPSSGTLSGTATVAAVAGVATFNGLSINRAGNGYTLAASSSGLTGATSNAFNITVGAPTQLAFLQQPTNASGGATLSPAPTVRLLDAGGNLTASTANVTLAIANNPSGGTLSGTATVAAVAGIATFNGLSINTAGTGYTLAASSSGLTGTTSSAFNITVGAPARVVFGQQPTHTTSGVAISPAPTVRIVDSGGNLTTSTANVTLAIGNNPAGGSLSGTATVAAVAGVATFNGLSINTAGNGYTLAASSSGLTGATSSAFNITVGAPAYLAFEEQPTDRDSTVPFQPAPTVLILDSNGNLTNSNALVTLSIGNNPSGGTLSGTTAVLAVGGRATFVGVSINIAGSGYTLAANSAGVSGTLSTPFNITVGTATQLVFGQQPTHTAAGATIVPALTVRTLDAGGNQTTVPRTVTLAIGSNPGGGTLSGTSSVSTVGGVATFSGLSINSAGTGYTLTASSSGLSGATSDAFDITVGAAAQLAFVQQPGNTTNGTAIVPAPSVRILDAGGNPTTSTANVTLAIGSNPGSGTLGGTATVAAVAGLATFPGLSINNAGTGYTLVASSSGLSGATSNAFDINGAADLSIDDVTISEGDSGSSNAVFTVSRSNNQTAFSVSYSVTAGTAQAVSDYVAVSGTLNFAVGGALTQTISVPVVGDLIVEASESATLDLGVVSNTSGITTLTDGSGLLTINDNDSAVVSFNPASVSQPESTTPMAFTVSLSNPVQSGVTLAVNSSFGTATAADFTPIVGGTVSFAANSNSSQTVNVAINNDALFESDESFTLTLSALTAVGNVTLGTATATGTIQNDDPQPTTVTISSHTPDPSVVGQPYLVSVTVTGSSTSPAGTVTIRDGGAGSPSCGPVALVAAAAPASTASCTLTSTSAGSKTLTADYTPADGTFAAGSSTAAHLVNPASTTISVVGPVRSRINQPTSFTFALSVAAPGTGTPGGTVTLSSGAASCTATLPATSCNLSFGALGSRSVSASYAGDSNFNASASSGAGNAQTLVYALSDLAISNSDGVGTYRPGDPLVYSIVVSNAGPDAAANIRVVDPVPANLSSVVWACSASGGGACPVSSGSGNLDLTLASMPVGALINITLSGIAGSAPTITHTASIVLPADTTIEDPVLGNNSASDTNLIEAIFANGFEGP
jgi:hypothetical protein